MDWQQRYASGDTPWDKGRAAPVLAEIFKKQPVLFTRQKRVLVPGCGLGYDAREIAAQGSSVMGVDVAKMAIDEAKSNTPQRLSVEYLQADIFNLPMHSIGTFDAVWEHTCFCAIEPMQRDAYVESMWRVLKPNAFLLGVFFTNPDMPPGEGPPYQTSREEVMRSFGSHFVLEWEMKPTRFYKGRENREHVMLFRRLSACGE